MSPVSFRPTEQDRRAMDLIKHQYPLTANKESDVIRKALEFYWMEHGPESKKSKSARLSFIEDKIDAILRYLNLDFSRR